jgi:4a-hydroxytetrahydrobiopterin dehydratase
MTGLADQRCEDCTPDTPPLPADDIAALRAQLNDAWTVVAGTMIHRDIRVADFMSAMRLAGRIAVVAEEQGHHPDLHVSWGRLGIDITTHAAHGLTRNDFILAAKIDGLAA